MNVWRSYRHQRWRLVSAALLLLLIAAPIASANERYPVFQDLPFYARIQGGGTGHAEEWAFVVFYRPPECVPDDFNLLQMFDDGAHACSPLTVDGFYIFQEGVWVPIQQKLHGLGAVPVWFVPWHELEAALGDDMLTIGELENLHSLMKGSASFYAETLHPYEAVKNSMHELVGKGLLEDGREFQFSAHNFDAHIKFR